MTRTEKLIITAVLVVNVSVGLVLTQRSDDPGPAAPAPLAPATYAALSPMSAAPAVTVSEGVLVARR